MTINLTIDDKYQAAYDRALVEHGANVVVELVTGWLADREKHQFNADLDAVKGGRADAATKARLKAALKL